MRLASSLVLAAVLVAPRAWADPPPSDIDRADALFQEGRALMDRGDVAQACPRLEQSFQIAPRLGTMLNLGSCFERNGQLARALAIYERAATMAHEAGRADREREARDLAAAVEPKVARLLVVVGEPPPGLTLTVDGEPLSTQVGLVPLDPGERKVRATAPGRVPYETVVVAHAGETVRVSIPPLEDPTHPSSLGVTVPPPAPSPARIESPPPPPDRRSSSLRTVGLVTGVSLAVAGAATGSVFGLLALSKHNESNGVCTSAGCPQPGEDLVTTAMAYGNLSTGAFIAAGAGVACAAVFFFAVPSASQSTRTSLRVVLGPSAAAVSGTF